MKKRNQKPSPSRRASGARVIELRRVVGGDEVRHNSGVFFVTDNTPFEYE